MANEKRLIDANALFNSLADYWGIPRDWDGRMLQTCEDALSAIEDAPTVDAVEVVRGHWREFLHSALVRWKDGEPVWADRSVFRCSRCDFGTIARHNYCPRCGAKMDGGNEDG